MLISNKNEDLIDIKKSISKENRIGIFERQNKQTREIQIQRQGFLNSKIPSSKIEMSTFCNFI